MKFKVAPRWRQSRSVCVASLSLFLALPIGLNPVVTAADLPVAYEIGGMMPHLTGMEREMFRAGREAFSKTSSVQGDLLIPNTESGLGPLFNGDSCAMCHAHPAVGGSSPVKNPQIEAAGRDGAKNVLPSFVLPDGPVVQARFQRDDRDRPDGSVHPLFTIRGRRDAGECGAQSGDFAKEGERHNVSLRVPPPLFGAGLIEAIPDPEIESSARVNADEKRRLGIEGHPNRIDQDGSIGRFGWKAQISSLEMFAAEAYAVEQGVTNELFPQERKGMPGNCLFNPTPEDRVSLFSRRPVDAISNVSRVAYFMRYLAPPPPGTASPKSERGKELFVRIGCATCHTPALSTGTSSHAALSGQTVDLYSDLLVHRMGPGLADGIRQGQAGPDEFRTAPLWGVGKRMFFLHDGRTRDLSEAILLHAAGQRGARSSEAALVIAQYRRLTQKDRDLLLQFLHTI